MSNGSAEVFVIIDGSSYLFRAYHALPPLTTSEGIPTGAIYGVINMIKNNLQRFKPNKMVVVFDAPGKNFRNDLYPEYKANRSETPDDLKVQFEPLIKIIESMGIKILIEPDVEADDVIATLAHDFANEMNILVSTSDKDLAQLVTDKVTLVNTMSDYTMDIEGVKNKFGVYPEQIIDYLTLVGDTVDNIPGVNKCGPKTAQKWIDEYKTLDNIVANADKIKGKVGEYLRDAIPRLPLYKELVTVKLDLKLNAKISDFNFQSPNNEQLKELYTKYNFKTWLKLLNKEETLGAPISDASNKDIDVSVAEKKPKVSKQDMLDVTNESLAELQEIKSLEEFNEQVLSSDKVNSGSNDNDGNDNTNICCFNSLEENKFLTLRFNDKKIFKISLDNIELIKQIFTIKENKSLNNNLLFVGYDIKDALKKYTDISGLSINNFFDIKLACYMLNSIEKISFADLIAKFNLNNENDLNEDMHSIYEIYLNVKESLNDNAEIKSLFYDVEMPLLLILSSIEKTGFLLDVEFLKHLSDNFGKILDALQSTIYSIAGTEFNLSSPKQLQEILFDKMNLPVLKKTPKGQPSTDESVLSELANNYEIAELMMEYRTTYKLKTTYTDKLPLMVDADNRIHTHFQQMVTSTGRLSSTEPNLQNIPVRTVAGKQIRSAFIAPDDKILIVADYSQIELRIMADLSQDPTLVKSFIDDLDIHSITASEVFNVKLEDVTQELRRQAKAINFGLIYGMSAFGLSKQLNISRSEAAAYMESYFTKFPLVKTFMEDTRKSASELGYVSTMLGRRLYLPQINAKQANIRAGAERAAINAPMQGGQSDIIKLAMLHLYKKIDTDNLELKMLSQIHDELIFEAPISLAADYVGIIKDTMENVIKLSTPLKVDVGTGRTWGDAK